MLPPVPAIVLGVKGDEDTRDDLTICWTFVLGGDPPRVGVSVARKSAISNESQVAHQFLREHGEFTLNVPDASWVDAFDIIDMCASERADKFQKTGLTRYEADQINAPGVAEAPIILECETSATHSLPPDRTLHVAKVVHTSVQEGVTDENGKLHTESRPFFGMTAGNGEFWTLDENIGRIGMTEDIDDIRY